MGLGLGLGSRLGLGLGLGLGSGLVLGLAVRTRADPAAARPAATHQLAVAELDGAFEGCSLERTTLEGMPAAAAAHVAHEGAAPAPAARGGGICSGAEPLLCLAAP